MLKSCLDIQVFNCRFFHMTKDEKWLHLISFNKTLKRKECISNELREEKQLLLINLVLIMRTPTPTFLVHHSTMRTITH